MLRSLVLVLMLCNVGFYAWTRGMLDGVVGMRAQGDREPERLARQVRRDTIRLLPPEAASAVVATPVAAVEPPPVCLEAGPYNTAQVGVIEGVLQGVLPPGAWANIKTDRPPVWIVYMGKYPSRELMQKKIDELKRIKVPYEEIHAPPTLDEGLSLGRFDEHAAADKALAELTLRGVRTARVERLSLPNTSHMLRVDHADAATQGRLAALRAEALLGRPFAACVPPKP